MMKRLLTILCIPALILCALAACAAPQHVQDEASMYLKGKCLETFLAGGPFSYQQRVAATRLGEYKDGEPYVAMVFALGEDETGNHQACASVSALQVGVSDPDKLAAMAIARCNEFGARWGINCKLFAVNNKIVWGKEEDVEFQ